MEKTKLTETEYRILLDAYLKQVDMEECDWDMVGKLAKLGDVREDDIIISPKFMAGVRA